ncbi:MAG: 2-hydroxyacyl-CoA dehydratase family protein [Proteobacteria bacterium]|nr:2-hydroxyacyl-CoA dehydratase family protein [Pseudomonadota bacterium]MBU1388562.1 2-hydroxyacyl-CoA dehydratase family protein [Pseudomonadota bacterium]MBU1541386.1 2-hydroxyacyl-CoA dehydratase family protein [Pseudomonadota bacterium]MBU2431080.1 2-hydroxyacyl-CoA dehydratase family protein [Pseudomonadota bacterium]MBU2480931.1 2-hydroxyacyl-CoA dehydratase family protein [Pseudomonadota bacterium]
MKELTAFHDAANCKTPEQLNISKKIIGYMCSYVPEELIHAAGFHPMRLFSSKSDIVLAENHLQAYCCSPVRGVLENSLSGRLDFLSGAVFPHTCDSIQRLSDIWRMNNRYEFFWDVVWPAKLNTQSALTYMKDVLIKFRQDLENACGTSISDETLHDSILTYNTIRKKLSRIYELNAQNPGILNACDLLAIVKGTMIMDRDTAAMLLNTIVDQLEKKQPPDKPVKRIIIAGGICDSPDVYTIIEAAGGCVVADDLCTGQRWFKELTDETTDPISALVKRYSQRLPCPAKHNGLTKRGDHLVQLCQTHKADGIVFMLLKFCDPHGFDYPYLKETLDKHHIKSILCELDDQQQNSGQLSTRIETFIHMI